jgi:hypothetical protein
MLWASGGVVLSDNSAMASRAMGTLAAPLLIDEFRSDQRNQGSVFFIINELAN